MVDRRPIVRAGLRALLEQAEGVVCTAEAADASAGLRRLAADEYDVVVAEASLPGRPVLGRLAAVVALGEDLDLGDVTLAADAETLGVAVRDALDRGRPRRRRPSCELLEVLSPQERRVFDLVVSGRPPMTAAALLDLKPSTVSTYLRRVRDKLGVESLAELTALAARLGLLD